MDTATAGQLGNQHFPVMDRMKIRQHIDRRWMRLLSPAEFKVLVLIFDRTIAWGRSSERISMREFVDGRGNYTQGTGMSVRTIQRALRNLIEQRIVIAELRTGAPTLFTINLNWAGTDEIPVPTMQLD